MGPLLFVYGIKEIILPLQISSVFKEELVFKWSAFTSLKIQFQVQGGILSGSMAAPLTKIFGNWTKILVENNAFLSHFGLE